MNSLSTPRTLMPHHDRSLIVGSGISPEVVAGRGYRSVTTRDELRRLGFAAWQCCVPALLVPCWSVFDADQPTTWQVRPDQPRTRNGKEAKYETVAGSRLIVDVHPFIRPLLGDPRVELDITEGAKKSDAAISRGRCCLALSGVYGWRGRNEFGGLTALPDWELITLNGRQVNLVFDSDAMTKPQVWDALHRFKRFLEARKAQVRVVYLAPLPDGSKCGLDDYVVNGGDVAGLFAAAEPTLRPRPGTPLDQGQAPRLSSANLRFQERTLHMREVSHAS